MKREKILFCGQSGYPSTRSATMNRYTAIAQLMQDCGEVVFINSVATKTSDASDDVAGFRVENVFKNVHRDRNIFLRNFKKLISPLMEIFLFRRISKESKIGWVNVYTQFFWVCVFYTALSKIFRYKSILHSVEKRSEFENRNIFLRLNDWLYESVTPFIFDRYFPISNFLNSELHKRNNRARSLIVPPICDFDYFERAVAAHEMNTEKYFLYCGSAAYGEVVDFIVDCFESANLDNKFKLYLVLNGKLSHETYQKIESKSATVKVFSNVPYNELISLYKQAVALLIPLRNTNQDRARFPQKICEYLAAKNLFISTNYGEVESYFSDRINALIASEYELKSFAEKISWAMNNDAEIAKIKMAAFATGRAYFDIKAYRTKIQELLND